MNSLSDGATLRRPPVELIRGSSIFLDFDGTLVDITATPDEVAVERELRDLLCRLNERLGGRLAILTGRAAAEMRALLEPSEIIVAGSHGLEVHGNTAAEQAERPASLDSLVSEFRRLEARFPGVLVEDKPLGLALHFRQAPEAEEACRTAATSAAERTGLELQPGKMVFELKPRGGNKGAALRTLMTRPPFAGSSPLFLGDDLTDEPGFEAARDLGGAGILIGEARMTAASFHLRSVGEALDWLSEASDVAA